MKLKSLRIHGFKSFADPIQVDFHDGITAVVGPNGCGKSNIKDAVRWVLGEQRPSIIRGAKMEEAIFQGSTTRRPVNRGSVSMIVSNEDGALPVPFEEVEIGRTIYRDGGSEYQINRSTCRLKDVVDLCRDTGLGANAYSVIENRMIDAILSDRAEERRALFEEAAGIGKYKDRRKAALRRLETAEVDLQRLEDVIAEVQTKVRSLARQKGKAQKYEELRSRRLAVEVEVVRHELTGLGGRLTVVEKELSGDLTQGEGVTAQLQTAEVALEAARVRQVQTERARTEAAARMDEVRTEVAQVERDLAVAKERAGYAVRRLDQIAGDAAEARDLVEGAKTELVELGEKRTSREAELERVQSELSMRDATASEVRARLKAARDALEAAENRNREVIRRVAQLEGDRGAALTQVEELGRRLERVSTEVGSGQDALSELRSQGDLFSDRRVELRTRMEKAAQEAERVRNRLRVLKEDFHAARTREMAVQAQAASAGAEYSAVKRLVDSREGSGPVVRAALEALPNSVVGTLSDFVEVMDGRGPIVDTVLGSFGQALVVPSMAEAETLSLWYREQWGGGGGLVVLSLDRVPSLSGSLPKGIRAIGEGAPWVKAILASLTISESDTLLRGPTSVFTASSEGVWIDRMGAIHLGDSASHGGLLERRERLEALTKEHGIAELNLKEAQSGRARLEEELRALETYFEDVSKTLIEARDSHRGAEMEAAAQTDRRARLDKYQEELTRQLEGTRAARDRALERSRAAEEERGELVEEQDGLQAAVESAGKTVTAVDQEWEEARSAQSQMTIEAAGLGHELDRVKTRFSDLTSSSQKATTRIDHLAKEATELTEDRARVEAVRRDGAERLRELFTARDTAGSELQERDEELQSTTRAVAESDRRVREVRAQERQAVDRRHQLQLEQQDLRNQMDRIRDRLETEWGRPLEALFAEAESIEGEPDVLRTELRELVVSLDRLGPVNMLAVEEHNEESERLDYLVEQREDLVTARDDLRKAISQINQTATELFLTSFHAVRENFQKTFEHLFRGGEADLWLADPENPLESPVEIHASPVGKTTQRIDLLSGGERALTALSLLFGLYLVKPSPFCVLDEVDAPLDESNISRFIRLLQQFKDQTQFIVITHNPRTIESADWIYGVTMEEPGVSTIVGVRLQEALEATGSAA